MKNGAEYVNSFFRNIVQKRFACNFKSTLELFRSTNYMFVKKKKTPKHLRIVWDQEFTFLKKKMKF